MGKMKIIQPAHNIPAEKVESWKEIKAEAEQIRAFIADKEFIGYWKDCYAIHHAQVSDKPKNFFILNESQKDLVKQFDSWVIINPVIKKFEKPIYYKQGCMSYPYRKIKSVECFDKITVEYYIPFMGFFLVKKKRILEDIASIVTQHECQHAEGKSIYFN